MKAIRNDDKLISKAILQELIDYQTDNFLTAKALRVMQKCIKSNRIALADRIQEKYQHILPNSDLVSAFKMLLYYQNSEKPDNSIEHK